MKQFPSFSQWKQIFKVLKKSEKISFVVFLVLFLASSAYLASSVYLEQTTAVPALGGTYTEGIVGQPRFINPVYGETNDVDRTLIDLVFSSLMAYDNSGHLTMDLAQDYHVSPDGKTYEFQLKDNILWHDGTQLTADDIVFTIKTIQNSDYKSPLRANWIDVTPEKVSDNQVRFTLKNPYNAFLENLTVKIIPKHIFEHISPENFALSVYNLQPIGSGPFQFTNVNQTNTGFIKTLNLASNRKYYNQPSYVANLSFQFFEKKEDLVKAAQAATIDGFTLASLDNNELETEKQVPQNWLHDKHYEVYSFSLPRYFAVFFNTQKNLLFADANLRQAMTYAVDKDAILQQIQEATKNTVAKVDSPILPDFYGYNSAPNFYEYNVELAKAALDKAGFKDVGNGVREKATTKKPAFQFTGYLKNGSKNSEVGQLQACLAKLDPSFAEMLKADVSGTYGKATEDAVTAFQKKYLPALNPTGETGASTRQKLNELCLAPSSNSQQLSITLVTLNQPQLVQIANSIKQYWESVGMAVEVNAVSSTDLKPIIKNRSYDALLYGEALGAEPDLYPFWHSSQKVDPGLNLSEYENKDVDQLLKDARQAREADSKAQKYEKIQTAIMKDAPALFLYNPNYIYWVSGNVHGVSTGKIIDPAKRFNNITNWYLTTKRVWK